MDPGYAILFGITALLQPDVSLDDLRAFPPPAVARNLAGINSRAERFIRGRESIDFVNPEWWWEARCQVVTAGQALNWLLAAQDEDYAAEHRLCKLRELRSLLGNAAYYGGRLPPAAPVWAFPRCDEVPLNPAREIPSGLQKRVAAGVR